MKKKILFLGITLLFFSSPVCANSVLIEYATLNPAISFIPPAYTAHSLTGGNVQSILNTIPDKLGMEVGQLLDSTAQVMPDLSAAQTLGDQIQAAQSAFIDDYPSAVSARSVTYFIPTDNLVASVFGYVIYSEITSGTLLVQSAQQSYTDPLNGAEILVFTPAPVPIPGAIWLLGSGLVGFVGFRRKKKA